MSRRAVTPAETLAARPRPRRPVRGPAADARAGSVEWRDPELGVAERSLESARGFPFETALPIRGMPAFKGQWSKPGRYWFSGCDAHVQYESRFEMAHLTLLDFDPRVVAVSGQPFRVRFGMEDAPFTHVPDLFVRYGDGTALVIDVKGALAAGTPANRKVFARTASACDAMGVAYRVATEPDPAVLANVRWLAGYRRPQHHTDRLRGHVLGAARNAGALGGAACLAARTSGAPEVVVRPVLFHLMWHRAITADLTRLFDNDTVLTVGDAGRGPTSGAAA